LPILCFERFKGEFLKRDRLYFYHMCIFEPVDFAAASILGYCTLIKNFLSSKYPLFIEFGEGRLNLTYRYYLL